MATLDGKLRRQLEHAIAEARTVAEDAAWAAMQRFAVTRPEPFPGMTHADTMLRVWLREQARQLSGTPKTETREDVRDLVEACAYEHWHRMLFARFLAENGLLIHPEYGMPVTLAECAELAQAEGDGDGWLTAARYAAHMLPGLFRANDPYLRVPFATDDRQRLEAVLAALPAAIFTAEDSLGWVYQFWQAKRKKEINESGAKIDNGLIAPVTQLFSEPYMVEFLLHNTLGAWWAARHPDSDLNAGFTYLRRTDDGTPICGTFAAWPDTAAALTVLDPCAGSGHFLQRSFHMLREMRMREEGLSAADAGDAVLRDNLYGLELDPRCVQIMTFSLAFEAWKSGGYRFLPVPHAACSGIASGSARNEEWAILFRDDAEAQFVLSELIHLFKKANSLSSLIGLAGEAQAAFGSSINVLARIQPKLEAWLNSISLVEDPAGLVFGESAAATVAAARLLLRKYHLVASNVPFLARGRQAEALRHLIEGIYPDGKADLATAMIERCRDFCHADGAYALVTPQNWLFLGSYKKLREKLLKEQTWHAVAKLGEGAFHSNAAAGAFVALIVLTNARPPEGYTMHGLDAAAPKDPAAKAVLLRDAPVSPVPQAAQLHNPNSVVAIESVQGGPLLSVYANYNKGISSGDYPRWGRCFWELPRVANGWTLQQSTSAETVPYSGMEHVLFWQDGRGSFHEFVKERLDGTTGMWIRGAEAWGKPGVAVSAMRELNASLYTGCLFDENMAAIVPRNLSHLLAIWVYCSSKQYSTAVRQIDQALKVNNDSLVKVPFDLAHWQAVAVERYPNGLPEPHSDDPTQWLFKGDIASSTDPLQVAVARLLGYRWPDQPKDDTLDAHADADGIVCIPPVRGETPAAERLRSLLAAAYGEAWSGEQQDALLATAGYGGKGLEAWLRDGFFAQHCARFGNRPFIWHLWDGRKDGFAALVNYHALDRQKLEKLTYTYLGDWLERQRNAARANEPGAEARVAAAEALQRKLALILAGEPPYDLFVRWKPLHQQAIGWEPDINDGVRLNIRPFVRAGVLRGKFTVGWKKDRGENPPSLQFYADGKGEIGANPPWYAAHREPDDLPGRKPNERHNDFHFARAEKQAARDAHDAANPTPAPAPFAPRPASVFDLAAGGGRGGGGSGSGTGGSEGSV